MEELFLLVPPFSVLEKVKQSKCQAEMQAHNKDISQKTSVNMQRVKKGGQKKLLLLLESEKPCLHVDEELNHRYENDVCENTLVHADEASN